MGKVTNYNTILPIMNTASAPIFLFDLDGTLVDTAPDLLTTVNALLQREHRPMLDDVTLRKLVGRGAKNLIAGAFAATGAPLAPAALEPLYAAFLDDYGSHIAAASRPYPGVVDTLTGLQAAGVRMGVLTNKPHPNARQLIDALGLAGFFGTVCGQGKHPWLKPDPRLFAAVLAELGATPATPVLMVGDSITDVETARAAGVPVILMSYGYTTEPAASLGADRVLDEFAGIPAAARQLLGIS